MGRVARGILIAGVVVLVAVVPLVCYRWSYTHSKRLREVVPGRVYRSGQMTAPGFAEAVRSRGIRTIVNLQDEVPDPDVAAGYFTTQTIKERELCRKLGVRYVHLAPDLWPPSHAAERRPKVIEEFLALMDDPQTYPVLLHCRAGLHRTGVLVAVYRMEYQGWGPAAAFREVRQNGFGDSTSNTANAYITQYVLNYHPGLRQLGARGHTLVPRDLLFHGGMAAPAPRY